MDCPDGAAGSISAFQNVHVQAALAEEVGGGQSRDAGAYDDRVCIYSLDESLLLPGENFDAHPTLLRVKRRPGNIGLLPVPPRAEIRARRGPF